MQNTDRNQCGAKNPTRGFKTSDPTWIMQFLLGLGYSNEDVVNTLRKRCNLSTSEATRLVEAHQQGGLHNAGCS